MLKLLFQKQKENLDHFFAHLDMEQCEQVFEALAACSGTLFFTGVGKSGFVAQKISATLLSTGSKSHFLQPIDALHGDLGMISSEDCLVILSKSGETDELLQLLPFVRNKGTKIVAITSNGSSRLSKAADFAATLPCAAELCPFDLAPTTSTEIQLLFGDVLSIGLMQRKGFTLDAFAENHPGGRIGKRIQMKVKDLMLSEKDSPICFAGDRLEDILHDFSSKRCGCMLVIDQDRRLKGIFTDGDLRRALQEKGEKVLRESLGDLMRQEPKAVDFNSLAWDALKLMEADQKHPITVLPVLAEDDKVVGVIKMHDILQAGI